MISKKFTLPLLFLLVCSYWASAQILDDSTKVIYGPTTTRYVLENDIFNNREIAYPLDTTLNGFHNFSFPARNQNLYQDLGNLGTAMRPVFYQPPAQIGAQLGYNAFTPYAFNPERIKYYDTKSPYTSLYYIQGGRGQQSLNFEFSTNINPQWNAGINYQRFTSLKQYGVEKNSSNPFGDRLVDHHAVVVFSRYKTKDSTYQIMGNFTHLNHLAFEQGGVTVKATAATSLDSLLNIDIANPVLKEANSHEIRNDYHIYQQYVPVEAFQLYHILDFQRHTNRFNETAFLTGATNSFYPAPDTMTVKSDTVSLENKYSLLENKVGIKGSFSGFNYRFHARRRDYSFTNEFDREEVRRSENFVGAWLNYYFADSTRVFGDAEYLIGKDYRIRGEYQGKLITAGYYRTFSSPTLVQTNFYSNPYHWSNNSFDNTRSDNVYGNLNVRLGGLLLQPNVLLSRIKNYVYFNETARPAQSADAVQMLRLGLTFEFRAKHFFTSHQIYYTKTGGANLLRIPEWFSNSRIAYELLFKKVLYIQTGAEVHYKSAYFADKYMPITQQYYLQNEFEVPGYPIVDVFANFRINRVRLFFKLGHINQIFPFSQLFRDSGYLTAPYYPGLRPSFGFGVNWMLFD